MKRRNFLKTLCALPFISSALPNDIIEDCVWHGESKMWEPDRIRGMRANSVVCDEYQEIDPKLFKQLMEGFASVN